MMKMHATNSVDGQLSKETIGIWVPKIEDRAICQEHHLEGPREDLYFSPVNQKMTFLKEFSNPQ